MDDATALVRAKTALEELGSAAAHRIGEWRAERLVDDVSAGLVELARVNQAAIGELLAERDEARAENERLRDHLDIVLGYFNRETVVTLICDDIDDALGALDDAAAALAAVQEPPAARPEGWVVVATTVRGDNWIEHVCRHGLGIECDDEDCMAVYRQHEWLPAQEPPAEGGDR